MKILRQIKQRISEKLGVCPFCMRASALGSLASWAIVVGARLMHVERIPAGPLLLALLVIVAWCFTLLICAHLVAYMVRVARDVRACEHRHTAPDVASPATALDRSTLSRREFMRVVLGAGAYAATIAVLGTVPTFGQAQPCTATIEPTFPDNIAAGAGANDGEATGNLRQGAVLVCDALCDERTCAGGSRCLQKGPPVLTQPKCQAAGGQRHCSASIKRCSCGCTPCAGSHEPAFPMSGYGIGANQGTAGAAAEADAKQLCDNFCNRFKNCQPLECVRDSDPQLGERKVYHIQNIVHVKIRIKRCKCKCA